MPASATPDKKRTSGAPVAPGIIPLWRSTVLAGVVAAAIILTLLSPDANSPTQAGVNMKLPSIAGMFVGLDQEMSPAEKAILPEDTELVRKVYSSINGDQIQTSIVLAGGEKRSIHRPEVCLPGQGWIIKSGEVVPIKLADGKEMHAMLLTLERDIPTAPGKSIKVTSLFLYWFVGKNVTTPSNMRRVWLTSWDRVVHNINHRWAFISMNALITDNLKTGGKNRADTLAMLQRFASDLVPKITSPETDQSSPEHP